MSLLRTRPPEKFAALERGTAWRGRRHRPGRARALLAVPRKVLVAELPVLPKLPRGKQHDDNAEHEMPGPQRARISIDEGRHDQPQPARDLGHFLPAFQ